MLILAFPFLVACLGTARALKQPFQGVRVKHPVKDLLNYLRSTHSDTKLESHLVSLSDFSFSVFLLNCNKSV